MFEYGSFYHLNFRPSVFATPVSRQWHVRTLEATGRSNVPNDSCIHDDMSYTAHLGTHTKFNQNLGKWFKKKQLFFLGMPCFFPQKDPLHMGHLVRCYHWYHHRRSCTWGNTWPSDFPFWNRWKKLASLSRLQLRHYIITGWWLPLVTILAWDSLSEESLSTG